VIGSLPIATEMLPIAPTVRGDRRGNGRDQDAADHQSGLDRANGGCVGIVIGPIDEIKDGEEGFFRDAQQPAKQRIVGIFERPIRKRIILAVEHLGG